MANRALENHKGLQRDSQRLQSSAGKIKSYLFGLFWFGLVPFDLSASVTSRHHRRAIYGYNSRDRPVKNITVSPTMSDGTQWVRVELGIRKTHLRSADIYLFFIIIFYILFLYFIISMVCLEVR